MTYLYSSKYKEIVIYSPLKVKEYTAGKYYTSWNEINRKIAKFLIRLGVIEIIVASGLHVKIRKRETNWRCV